MCIRDRAKIYGVSLDWLCSDSDMADEKPIEVVSPLEENETKNTTVSAVSYTHLDVYKRQA